MKQIIFSIFAVIIAFQAKAQVGTGTLPCGASATNPITCTFLYTYDNAGNRVSRDLQICACPDVNGGRLANPTVQTGSTPAAATSSTPQITSIAPNPTSSGVTIQFSGEVKTGALIIMDSTGKVLYEIGARGSSLEFDFSEYPSGLYYVSLRTDSGIQTQKVIKSN